MGTRKKFPDGTVLAGYPLRIGGKIGSGGMAVVYEAEDLELGVKRAVKVLDVGILGVGGQDPVEELRREARTMAKLHQQCPEHIVQVLYVGQTKDEHRALFIVMERLVGGSLKDILRMEGAVHWSSAKQIFQNVAAALAAAHDDGYVHRDVKPANIYCAALPNRQGARFLLLDFGIAALMDTSTESRFVGTFKYAAPEQAQSRGRITSQTDIYSFGVTFYELLAGRHPFAECVTDATMLRAHRDTPPPPLRTFVPSAPVALERLLASMLAKEPSQRPASMRRALDMLNEIYWDDQRELKAPEDTDTTVEDIGTVAQNVDLALQAKRIPVPQVPTDPMLDEAPPPAPDPNGPSVAPVVIPQNEAGKGAAAPNGARPLRNEISATLESPGGGKNHPIAERPVVVRIEERAPQRTTARISVSPLPPPAIKRQPPRENVTAPLYGAPALPPEVERARAVARYRQAHDDERVEIPVHRMDWRVKLLGGATLFAAAVLSIGLLLHRSSSLPAPMTTALPTAAVSVLAPIAPSPSSVNEVEPSSFVSQTAPSTNTAIPSIAAVPTTPTASAIATTAPRSTVHPRASSSAPPAAVSSASKADPDMMLFMHERPSSSSASSARLPGSGL